MAAAGDFLCWIVCMLEGKYFNLSSDRFSMLVCVYVESCFAVAVCFCWENYYLIVSVWHWFSTDEG